MNGIVYKATNKINNKIYIGKTIQSLKRRKQIHIAIAKKGNNYYFHRAIRKYGWDNFEWEILTETDSESKLNALEKFYIAAYRKMTILYNMTDGGEGINGENNYFFNKHFINEKNGMYGKHHSEETRKKISESLKGNIPWNKGRPCTEEAKKKISKANKGKLSGEKHPLFGKPRSEEMKRKQSIAMRGRKLTEEHKRKISENHAHISGKDHPMYGKKGKKHPLYGKRNLNLTKRNLENNPMKNIESKNKMIQSLKIYYKNKEKNEK